MEKGYTVTYRNKAGKDSLVTSFTSWDREYKIALWINYGDARQNRDGLLQCYPNDHYFISEVEVSDEDRKKYTALYTPNV